MNETILSNVEYLHRATLENKKLELKLKLKKAPNEFLKKHYSKAIEVIEEEEKKRREKEPEEMTDEDREQLKREDMRFELQDDIYWY